MRRGKNRPYRAYLLRCWQEEDAASGGKPLWRFSVEEILPIDKTSAKASSEAQPNSSVKPSRTSHKRRRRGFSSLDALIAHLKAQLAEDEDEPLDEPLNNEQFSKGGEARGK